MRHRWPTVISGLLLLALPACAAPAPVCGRPEVLGEVARVVRQWNVYNRIDDHYVSEASAGRPNAVICHTVMLGAGYEVDRGLSEPRTTRVWRRYDVEVSGNRFTVQVPR